MSKLLDSFRDEYLEMLLEFLWRDWSVLGVAGQRKAIPNHVIDPEALLLLTCTIGRYDQRLFDEVLDWLRLNGRFINVQRIRTILRREAFKGGAVLGAIADWLMQHDDPLKWKLLAKVKHSDNEPQSLFYQKNGKPLPEPAKVDPVFMKHGFIRNPVELRKYSKPFSPASPTNTLLKLRALMGVNARCDVLAYLALNTSGYAGELARELYYSQKAIHDIMKDMACSGFISSVKITRERNYRLTQEMQDLVLPDTEGYSWCNWAVLLSTVEKVWFLLEDLYTTKPEPHVENSEILLTMRPLLERIMETPWMPVKPGIKKDSGEAVLGVFKDICFQLLLDNIK